MKAVVLAAVLTLMAGHAAACDETLFEITGWSAGEETKSRLSFPITVDARYNGDRPIRMNDTYFDLTDILGSQVGEGFIPRDLHLEPGEEFTFESRQSLFTSSRLPDLNPDDVVATLCTRGVVYADGTVEKFDDASNAPTSSDAADPLSNILRNLEALSPSGSPTSPQ